MRSDFREDYFADCQRQIFLSTAISILRIRKPPKEIFATTNC